MNIDLKKIGRKQRNLLVLPLLVLPFVTMAFWALGGGKGSRPGVKKETEGFNMQLPQAQLPDDQNKTKLSFYEAQLRAADADSTAVETSGGGGPEQAMHPLIHAPGVGALPFMPPAGPGSDPNEAKVYQKLAELNKALSATPPPSQRFSVLRQPATALTDESPEVERLHDLMHRMEAPGEPDPELAQLNGLMDKILTVQAAGQRKPLPADPLPKAATAFFSVHPHQEGVGVSCLGAHDSVQPVGAGGFYGLTRIGEPVAVNTISAEVYRAQTLVDGASLTLRTLAPLQVNKAVVPAGSYVSGTCTLRGERLQVAIQSIRSGGSVYPVRLEVFDLDGNQGLFIPGAITRDVAKDALDRSIQQLSPASLDPSLKVQAADAGIQAMKSLFSKKAKQVKVRVRDGYKVLLKPSAL